MKTILAILYLFLSTNTLSAHQNIHTCEEVRAFVAHHGKAKALALALKHGATWAEIKQARKCLK